MTEIRNRIQHWRRRFRSGGDRLSRRLNLVVLIFVLAGAGILALDQFNAYVTSSVRAYIAGEGFYSKGQKNAVYFLNRYANSGDPRDYQAFLENIAIPLGDQQARVALQEKPPDLPKARAGLLAARNHPEDIGLMVSFFRNFAGITDMRLAIEIWAAADEEINKLVNDGNLLHREMISGSPDQEKIDVIMDRVHRTNKSAGVLQNRFSETLNESARRISTLSRSIILAAFILLSGIAVLLSRAAIRNLSGAQKELEQNEARFRHIVESNIIGIMFWQLDGKIQDANDAFLAPLGYTREDLPALNWHSLTPEEFRARDQTAIHELLRQGYCEPFEKAFLHRDGHRVPVLLGAANYEPGGTSGVCFVVDISEQKRLEEQIHENERMDAIANLVGGIAHDFNNTLAAVIGNIEMTRHGINEDDTVDATRSLLKAEDLSWHMSRIVQQLLIYAREDFTRLQPMALGPLFDAMRNSLESLLPKDVTFVLMNDARGLNIIGDASQIEQMVTNVVLNAKDAVTHSPNATIEVLIRRYSPSAEFRERHRNATAGSYARITVSDNGIGMAEEVRRRMFEPFFTTREVGKGTGLGMSMVFGSVQSHSGVIEVDSAENEGTTVHIYLPLQLFPTGESRREPPAADSSAR